MQQNFLNASGIDTPQLDALLSRVNAKISPESKYWHQITPRTNKDRFRRFLFAVCSVISDWESNVRAYNAIKNLKWMDDKEDLRAKLLKSGVGLTDKRVKSIWQLRAIYLDTPTWFARGEDESWEDMRERVMGIFLLSWAKATFAITLSYPESPLVCLDRHIARLIVGDPTANIKSWTKKRYVKLEDCFRSRCNDIDAPPAVAREIIWNEIQNRRNSRYWSYCLESGEKQLDLALNLA